MPKWVLFDNSLGQQSAASPLHKLEGRMKMKEKKEKRETTEEKTSFSPSGRPLLDPTTSAKQKEELRQRPTNTVKKKEADACICLPSRR